MATWTIDEEFARGHARALRDLASVAHLRGMEAGEVETQDMFWNDANSLEALAVEFERAVKPTDVNAELLDALKDLRAWCIPGMNWTDETGEALLAQADAAIAKAHGHG